MQNWNDIGTVTVRDCQGRVHTYATLADAVRAIGPSYPYSPRRVNRRGWITNPEWFSLGGYGDTHLVYDELGLLIPAWKIDEAFRFNPPKPRRYHGRRSRKFASELYGPEGKHFRKGAVEGIHNRCWRGFNHYSTTPEARENNFINDYDEDAADYGIKVRANRSSQLPNPWDWERHYRDDKSWKEYPAPSTKRLTKVCNGRIRVLRQMEVPMALMRNIPVFSSDCFTFHKSTNSFTAEISELVGGTRHGPWARVWDDAIDEGLYVTSAKTGEKRLFTMEQIMQAEGDVHCWILREYNPSTRCSGDIRVEIFND